MDFLPCFPARQGVSSQFRQQRNRNFADDRDPLAMASLDPRPTLAAPDDDPYLWLEEVDGERVIAWVDGQNAATLGKFGDARFAADRDVLAAIFDRPDNIPIIARRGARVFN